MTVLNGGVLRLKLPLQLQPPARQVQRQQHQHPVQHQVLLAVQPVLVQRQQFNNFG